MKHAIPVIVDRMPQEASADPPYSPAFLIALALSTVPYSWSGKLQGEESIPVTSVISTLKRGGYKIIPMERADYERALKER